jgi:hypothetical protein
MRKNKFRLLPVFALIIALLLAGCKADGTEEHSLGLEDKVESETITTDTEPENVDAEPEQDEDDKTYAEPEEPDDVENDIIDTQPENTPVTEPAEPAASVAELYIFTGGDEYDTYTALDGSTPNELVAQIAELTGWDLTLTDEITSGKGGITVSFSKSSCLFTGAPEEQKDEFRVYDDYTLTFAVLDSIQRTLQCWASPVYPDNVDVYFCMEGDVPLELSRIGVTLPMDEPYSHALLESLLAE